MSYINYPIPGNYPHQPETVKMPDLSGVYHGVLPEGNPDKIQSDGGPASYYDFPESWKTFNDFIEGKSQTQWLGFSFHLGNIGKALCRWGDKDGTSIEYDAKKIIYSGVRVLKMIIGVEATRLYLFRLLDDPQFRKPD